MSALLRDDLVKLDSYRLREDGPRDHDDKLYAPPKFRDDLQSMLRTLGDTVQEIPCYWKERVEWSPKGKVLFFTVRGEWQGIIFSGLQGDLAKTEVYAPILLSSLAVADVATAFGETEIIVLNPTLRRITEMENWAELQEKTKENCERRGDPPESVRKRVASVTDEAPAWKELIRKSGATDFVNWPFPEHIYKMHDKKSLLSRVRQHMLAVNPRLEIFLKQREEIA